MPQTPYVINDTTFKSWQKSPLFLTLAVHFSYTYKMIAYLHS